MRPTNTFVILAAIAVTTGCTLPGITGTTCAEGQVLIARQGKWRCMPLPASVMGEMGATGTTGQMGATGTTGPAGATGATGATGAAAATGPTGAAGATGLTGNPGATGALGTAGSSGSTGTAGAAGATGPAGQTGTPALAWLGPWNGSTNYAAGTIVEFEGSAYVSTVGVSVVSPPATPWQLLTQAGATGEIGATGAAGTTGAAAGSTGAPGATGAVGATGNTGQDDQGTQGNPGVTGAEGATGATGEGLQGDTGAAGATGGVGSTGLTGAVGAVGATGQGILGNTGATGATGAVGSAPSGATGATGAPAAAVLPSCPVGEFLASTDGGWGCGTLPAADLATAQSCVFGTVSQWNGTSWICVSLAAQTYACPPGYVGQPVSYTGYSAATAVSEEGWSGSICTTTLGGGQTDEMVKVGDFWIDRFELSASSTSSSICGASSPNPSTASLGGAPGYLTGASGASYEVTTAVGCSVRGVQPIASITWFQAEQLCVNAGKELCTNAEWQGAVSGTPDPGNGVSIPYGGAALDACNVASNAGRGINAGATSGTPANTLAHVDCVSSSGAYDMIGNVWESTAEWWQAGSDSTFPAQGDPVDPWPGEYGDGNDSTYNVNGSAVTSGYTNSMPAAPLRGGNWDDGSAAGAFALTAAASPAQSTAHYGARCCSHGR